MRASRVGFVAAIALLVTMMPAITATAVAVCDTTPTGGVAPRHPYLGRDGADVLAANPLYSYAENPYVYTLFVPEGLPDGPVPLVVALHGLGNSAANYENKGLQDLATRRGLIVAFVSGARSWWATEDSLDVKLVRDVVADVRAERCIDARRIWATGVSNGAFMAQRLACDAADLFAAVTAWAATPADGTYPFGGPCRANEDQRAGFETAPIAFWQGTADETVAYETGRRVLQSWVDRYRCDTTPVAVETTPYGPVEHYGGCTRPDAVARAASTGVPFEVRFRTVDGHPHVYPDDAPGLPTADEINDELYAFLSRHPRANPAAEQPAPDPTALPVRDPARHAAWLAALPDHGPRTELALVDGGGRRVATADALRAGVLTVHYAVHAEGSEPDPLLDGHPQCPTTAPGSRSPRYLGRPITLRLTDARGTTTRTATTAEQDGTGLAVATFPIERLRPGTVTVELTTEPDRVASPLLCTARGARFQETVRYPRQPAAS